MSPDHRAGATAHPSSGLYLDEGLTAGNLPLGLIAGLHEEAQAELSRAGIRTIENLASANPMALLAQTAFSLEQIVDWVGQALLINYFGDERAGTLRRFGVRTILNLLIL